MKRFLTWIIYGNILILHETDSSQQKTIIGNMDLAGVAKLWKQTAQGLTKMQEMIENELPEDTELSAEKEQEARPLKRIMKFTYFINQQLEHDLNNLIKHSSDTERMSHEFQYWTQSLQKSVKKVSKQITDLIKRLGLRPVDPSSFENLESEIKNIAHDSVALTVLLPNSNFTCLERFVQSLTQTLTDFADQKMVEKMELAEVAKLWKETTQTLTKIQGFLENESIPKGTIPVLSEEDQKIFEPFKQIMKFVHLINEQLETYLIELIRNSSDAEKTSHEFQHWQQSLQKSINKVSNQITDLITRTGLKPIEPSSVEKLEREIENIAHGSVALTVLLQKSNFTFLERFSRSLLQLFVGLPK